MKSRISTLPFKILFGCLLIASTILFSLSSAGMPAARAQAVPTNTPDASPNAEGIVAVKEGTDNTLYASAQDGFQIIVPSAWQASAFQHTYVFSSQNTVYQGPQLVGGASLYLSVFDNRANLDLKSWARDHFGPALNAVLSGSFVVATDSAGGRSWSLTAGNQRIYSFSCDAAATAADTRSCSLALSHLPANFQLTNQVTDYQILNATGLATVVKMPFGPGANWRVVQGYRTGSIGGTHKGYQALSLDIRRDTATPNVDTPLQPALAPINGSLAWGGTKSNVGGCMSIKANIAALGGTDFARVMICHIMFDRDFTLVTMGQALGYIAGPTQDPTNNGVSHIHISLYKLAQANAENGTRIPIAFSSSGANAGVPLDGRNFPDDGTVDRWTGFGPITSTNWPFCARAGQMSLAAYCVGNGSLYGATSTGDLWQIDPNSGKGSVVRHIGYQFTDIAFDGQTLYAVDFSGLYRVNPGTGLAVYVGYTGYGDVNGLAVAPSGTLYASTGGGALLRINKSSGAAARVGYYGSGLGTSGDVAISPAGVMYASITRTGYPNDWLARINMTTGAATPIGSLGRTAVFGLAFKDGSLYGITEGGVLVQINTTTGATTKLGTLSGSFWGLTAFIPAPGLSSTPASWDYGVVPVGTTSPAKTFTIKNTGNTNLVIGTISLAGTSPYQFRITGNGCTASTLAPGGTCIVTATFKPTTTGSKSAYLNILDNAAGSPHKIPLTGTGGT